MTQGYDKMADPNRKREDTDLHDNNYRSIPFAISPHDSSYAFSIILIFHIYDDFFPFRVNKPNI